MGKEEGHEGERWVRKRDMRREVGKEEGHEGERWVRKRDMRERGG